MYYAREREQIRKRKEAGEPWPLTDDPILRVGSFCNVRREDDSTSRWLAEWYAPHVNEPDCWFLAAVARLATNEPTALAAITVPLPWDKARFKAEMRAHMESGGNVERAAYTIHVDKASYKAGGYTAKFDWLADQLLDKLWQNRERDRPKPGEPLQAFNDRLIGYRGVKSFYAAQVIADVKQWPAFTTAPDWYDYVAPGPGSGPGLRIAMGRDPQPWSTGDSWHPAWCRAFQQFRAEITPELEALDLHLDAQNVQNLLCEGRKLWRARQEGTMPRRNYHGAPKSKKRPPEPAVRDDLRIPEFLNRTGTPIPPAASEAVLSWSTPTINEWVSGASPIVVIAAALHADTIVRSARPNGGSGGNGWNGGGGNDYAGYPHGERLSGHFLAEYIYRDATGANHQKVARTSTKQFPQWSWINSRWQLGAPAVKLPYRLPELLAASASEPVWICEGEKDADSVAALGLIATTNPGGAKLFQPELAQWFRGRQCAYILEDHDDAGREHTRKVLAVLTGIVPSIGVVAFPELPEKGDVSDWLAQGGNKNLLLARAAAAPKHLPPALHSVYASDVSMTAVDWLWPNRFALGKLGIIAGLPDEGKGLLISFIAAQVTIGGTWPCAKASRRAARCCCSPPKMIPAIPWCRVWRRSAPT